MNKMTKFKASEVYKYITVGERKGGESYYYLEDNTPDDMYERWQELIRQYDDYSFVDIDEYHNVLYTLVSLMADYGDSFTEDTLYEIDWRDTYNDERVKWLYDNLSRAQYYDDIKGNGAEGIFELIGDMQDFSRGQFASYIFNNFLEV